MSRALPLHVILDRDGVLNEEAPNGGYISTPADWRWISGALEGLAMLSRAGVRLSIATNQSGVGRGLMSESDLEAVHHHMLREARENGADIAGVFVCPHAPTAGCDCRKPAPGLLTRAMSLAEISAEQTLMVGDDLRDLDAASSAGVPAALVLTGKGRGALVKLEGRDVPVYESLRLLVAALLAKRF